MTKLLAVSLFLLTFAAFTFAQQSPEELAKAHLNFGNHHSNFMNLNCPIIGIPHGGGGPNKVWCRRVSSEQSGNTCNPGENVLDDMQSISLGTLTAILVEYHSGGTKCRGIFTMSNEGGTWKIVSYVFETRH